ncbi:hypothetical protein GCM10010464_85340 [Pseudonocardia yunnanensis]|uniref:Uncharacterized protein n=1 Tax=Pseudonocardia yunnanensis TaxID=58107 RepID=A0ABW4F3L7_9PSEU
MTIEPTRMLTGPGVLRVVWLPGSDQLQGTCHCGAVHIADGPVEVWDWLLAHPVGHEPPPAVTHDQPVLVGAGV